MFFIKDEVLNENYLKYLFRLMTENNEFPWYYIHDTAGNVWSNEDHPSFVHTLFKDGKPNSPFWDLFHPSIIEILDNCETPYNEVMRVRLGLITKNKETIVHGPHVDWQNFEHKTILFYFNDSDGDTYFFKERWSADSKHEIFNVEKTVSPKANRLVLFDGYQYHSSSTPTQCACRIAMNINFF